MVSNIQEVRARGATVIGILSKSLDDTLAKTVLDHIIYIPSTHPLIAPSLAIIPAQFLGYYIAKELGCEIDQPRNLAKSVTVE
jgi:glucosamine--fructose-6-phosphate aminotransferase (isomerizing)